MLTMVRNVTNYHTCGFLTHHAHDLLDSARASSLAMPEAYTVTHRIEISTTTVPLGTLLVIHKLPLP